MPNDDFSHLDWQKSFDLFMESVNVYLMHYVGMTADEIEDFSYADHFDDGVSSRDTAREALEYNGFQF